MRNFGKTGRHAVRIGAVERHLEGVDAAFLQQAGRAVVDAAPEKVAFLTATRGTASLSAMCVGTISESSEYEVVIEKTEGVAV